MAFGAARANAKVQCSACNHGQLLNQGELMALFPMPVSIEEAQRRLRCSVCGAKAARITPIPQVR